MFRNVISFVKKHWCKPSFKEGDLIVYTDHEKIIHGPFVIRSVSGDFCRFVDKGIVLTVHSDFLTHFKEYQW